MILTALIVSKWVICGAGHYARACHFVGPVPELRCVSAEHCEHAKQRMNMRAAKVESGEHYDCRPNPGCGPNVNVTIYSHGKDISGSVR